MTRLRTQAALLEAAGEEVLLRSLPMPAPVDLARIRERIAFRQMLQALEDIVYWQGERDAQDRLLPASQQEQEIGRAMRAIALARSTNTQGEEG